MRQEHKEEAAELIRQLAVHYCPATEKQHAYIPHVHWREFEQRVFELITVVACTLPAPRDA